MLKHILKNASYLWGAQIAAKGLAFLYNLILIDYLAPEHFGLYTIALSYFSILSAFLELGIANYLIREINQTQRKVSTLLTTTLLLRVIVTVVSLLMFSIGMLMLDQNHFRASLVIVTCLAVLPQGVGLLFDSYFVATQRLRVSAINLVWLSLVNLIIGGTLIFLGFGVGGAVVSMVVSQIIYAGSLAIWMSKANIKFETSINSAIVKDVVRNALPYGFLSILGLLYFKIDALLLGYIQGEYAAGIYGAAYRFLEAIVFVPAALSSAIFPLMAKLGDHENPEKYALYKKALWINLLLSIPIALAFYFLLPLLFQYRFRSYLPSIEILRILSLTIPFLFMISPQGIVLLSQKRFLKPLIIMSLFNLALNVGLNLIFIPQFSYVAAAWITLLSDIIGFLIFFIFIRLHFTEKS